MKNCDFIEAKTKILNGEPVTDATLNELYKLKRTYSDGIAEELSKPIKKVDNGWVAKMIKDKKEIEKLILVAENIKGGLSYETING